MTDSVLQLWHGVLFRRRPDASLEWIGARLQEWTGLEPHRTLEAVHPADRAKLAQDHITLRLRHALTGRITWVEQRRHALPGGYEGCWEDVTDRVRLNHQLARLQWNATLGLATNRLVHDFNNLLTGILSLSDAYLLKINPADPAHEGFRVVNQQAHKAAEIVQKIGCLFREVPGRRDYHNLCDIATAAGEMLRSVLPRHTSVSVQAEGDSIPVFADAVGLKQVVISLAIAAAPASVSIQTRSPATLVLTGRWGQPIREALVHAQDFAARNDAQLTDGENIFTFTFPAPDFSDAEARQAPCILMAGRATKALYHVADLFRRNGCEVVVGGEQFLDLLSAPDYRFDAVWMRKDEAAQFTQPFPGLKRIVSAANTLEEMLAELREANL